ncbi:MAG: HAD family hydrolase [Chitinophagales bacterium]|nr:HAD family hydrolase [Chitinophagales bacterium]
MHIDKKWTLFLDRDGVINRHLPNEYVTQWSEFEFIEGSAEAIAMLSKHFGKIVVVTNQQGVGKGLMSQQTLEEIHFSMCEAIAAKGGRIDAVYYCPHLSSIQPKCRKPEIGMALEAKEEFPMIDFHKSIMVGDSDSDMEFGNRLDMHCVRIHNPNAFVGDKELKVDATYKSLMEFAEAL